MFALPAEFPIEFHRDVVAAARAGEVPLAQIAKDFGSSQSRRHTLIKAAADIHADDPALGYQLIGGGVPGRGISAGENKVA